MKASVIACVSRCGLVLALLLGAVGHAEAQLLAQDGFGNGPLANLAGSTGGSGWATPWSAAGTNPTQISTVGLTWPGLATTSGAARTPVAGGSWPNSVYQRGFALPPGTNTLYISFLLRDDAAWGAWGGLSFGTYPYEMTVGSPLGYYSYGLMLSEGLGDVSGKALVQGETTLVVVKISKNTPAAGITYRMFLDPAVGAPEPGFPDAIMGVAPVVALPTALSIDNGTGFTTDEIRVGTTWASVLPAPAANWHDLGFSKVGTLGRPELLGSGPLAAGSSNQLALRRARPGSLATLIAGWEAATVPFFGGKLVPLPQALLTLPTSVLGDVDLNFTWPAGVSPDTPIYLQFWIVDPAATEGYCASNALQGVSS